MITGYGFESNQELTEYEIKNTTGIFTIEDNASGNPTNATDSLSNNSIKNDWIHK